MPGHISTETVTFSEQDGGTLVSTVSVFDSQEDRDGMLHSGMEQGLNQATRRSTRCSPGSAEG